MRLSDKQKEYWLGANHRWNIKYGATRSGKTYLDYYMIPRRIRACTGGGRIVIMGVTKNTVERNVLEPMRSIYGAGLVSGISSNNTAVLFGRRCHVLGAEKVSMVSKLQGAGIEYCYGDEVTNWNEEVFAMLKSRLDRPASRFDGTCNPESPNHWLKKFIDREDLDVFAQRYTLDDNPFLTPSFAENLKREYAGTVYYDRFILGKWVAAEGVIYRQFADKPENFILDDIDPKEIAFATIGVDFGGNKSAHAFVCTGFTLGMRSAVALDEFYLREKISPTRLDAEFAAFVRRQKEKYTVFEAYCDSAETTLIQGLQTAAARENLGIDVLPAIKGRINDRIRFYSAAMAQGRYKLLRRCEHLREAFMTAVWDGKSLEDRRLDDGRLNVDSLDAAEYSTERYMKDFIEMGIIYA